METVTPKGMSLIFALREEAQRLGLPDIEDASDDDLQQLVHVLPPDDHKDAEEYARNNDCTKDEFLVTVLRVILQTERPVES